MKKADANDTATVSQIITNHIAELADWRSTIMPRLRQLILDATPALVEEWKWSTPVWSHQGNVVAAGAFKYHVKLNFFKGAMLHDSDQLFNAGLDAKATRAIDIHEGDQLNEFALQVVFCLVGRKNDLQKRNILCCRKRTMSSVYVLR